MLLGFFEMVLYFTNTGPRQTSKSRKSRWPSLHHSGHHFFRGGGKPSLDHLGIIFSLWLWGAARPSLDHIGHFFFGRGGVGEAIPGSLRAVLFSTVGRGAGPSLDHFWHYLFSCWGGGGAANPSLDQIGHHGKSRCTDHWQFWYRRAYRNTDGYIDHR